MDSVYFFLKGPMMWISFIVFCIGILYQVYRIYSLARKKETMIFSYISLKYGLRSVMHWILPFGSVNMRRQPAITIVGLCLPYMPSSASDLSGCSYRTVKGSFRYQLLGPAKDSCRYYGCHSYCKLCVFS